MTEDIIKRAARATFEAIQADGGGFKEAWDDPSMERVRQTYLVGVRATIAAIREPSGQMLGEAHDVLLYAVKGEELEAARTAWERMIDAALAE